VTRWIANGVKGPSVSQSDCGWPFCFLALIAGETPSIRSLPRCHSQVVESNKIATQAAQGCLNHEWRIEMNGAKTIRTNKTIATPGFLLDVQPSDLAAVEGGIDIRYEDYMHPKDPDVDTTPRFPRSWQPIA
jgi:hypothetical protein